MGQFNQDEFNTGQFNGPSQSAPAGPVYNPQITIANPLPPPPQQFTNVSTMINGGYKEAGVRILRNGLLQTEGYDYTRQGGILTMLLTPPQPGDIITAQVFAIGKQLGGEPYRERYIAPWPFVVTGAFDGISTLYEIVFGPTISGGCDGRNNVFTWGVNLQRAQVWKNGILQTSGADMTTGPNAVVFLPGAIPRPGDLLTVLGY